MGEVSSCLREQRGPVRASLRALRGSASRSSPSTPGSRPPSRNRSLHAFSPVRSAARLSAGSSRLHSLGLTCYYARDSFPAVGFLATCLPAGLRPAPVRGHRPALAPPCAFEHSGPPPGADALCQPCCPGSGILTRGGNPDPGQQGSRDLQREAGTVVMASRTNRREREPWVSRPRHLPGAP